MLYRDMGKTGDQVSILGYGCMRFPRKGGRIDEIRTEQQILAAIEKGVNYFDTAYLYPQSEATLGKILAKGHRDKVLIASKLPCPLVHSRKDMDNILETQLQRLQTDHIDYYLLHSMMSRSVWERLKELGVIDFLAEAKAAGKIKRIGFSYHGEKEEFKQIVDDYPWDFCQIQYNYLDENHQAGKEGLMHAASKGLGVVIMEPLRGGALVGKMPASIQSIWDRAETKRSSAEWALRWLWNHPEVTVVLSGMNEEAHVEENLRIACEGHPDSLSESELGIIGEVKTAIAQSLKVGCTGCAYCMPCPAGVNIPMCFSYYNSRHLFSDRTQKIMYLGFTAGTDGGKPSYASLCKDCGKCEKHCPQSLPIRQHLKEVSKEMESFYFKPAIATFRALLGVISFVKGRKKTV